MRYRVTHTTTYGYAEPVATCHNELRLTPRTTARQSARRTQLLLEPAPATLVSHRDFFGNVVTFVTVQEPHQRLVVTAMSDVEVAAAPPLDLAATPPWEAARDRLRADRTDPALEAYQHAFDSPLVAVDELVRQWAAPSFPPGRPLMVGVRDLVARLHAEFAYAPATTAIGTPIAEILRLRRGVCQDFAHLAIGGLRALGLAARYVSGYLETFPPPGAERLVGADASHAWLAVFVPGLGWVDADPTNDLVPCTSHVTLAWGRDYADVPPVKGVILGGGEHTVAVAVDVQRLG